MTKTMNTYNLFITQKILKIMTPMQQIAYDTICEIQDIKREAGRSPNLAFMSEITNSVMIELKAALNDLSQQEVIEWSKTVNGMPMFGIKQEK